MYVRSSPVYTLTNIIIDKLAGIQLRAVQSQGGAERGVEQKPLVNSGNIAEGRKIVSASGRRRSLPALRGRRDVATSASCGRRQQEGRRGVPRTVNISPIGDERTDGQTSLQTEPRLVCVVFDVSQTRRTECRNNGVLLHRITNNGIRSFTLDVAVS